MIGINACDSESNTYLWHVNALIHSSVDLDHLILGLEIMFERFLKVKKNINQCNTKQKTEISQNINNKNETPIGIYNDNLTEDGNDDDRSHFLQLKSRSASHSPKKRKKRLKINTKDDNSIVNKDYKKHTIIQPCYNTMEIIDDITSNNDNNNESLLDIKGEGPINIKEDSVEYIAKLLLTPEHSKFNSPSRVAMNGTLSNINKLENQFFNTNIQSSPNATTLKKIKRIRQQERNYILKMNKKRNNIINNDNIVNNTINNNINNNNENIINIGNNNIAAQMSPFEISKFVNRVDQLQQL